MELKGLTPGPTVKECLEYLLKLAYVSPLRSKEEWTKHLLGYRVKNDLIDKEIFVQASAEPNDCVKPNEQNRVYSNFAMASNRTFKNLFGLCQAQSKMSRKGAFI